MDEVLADTLAAQIEWFRERFGYTFSKPALAGRELKNSVAARHWAVRAACLEVGAFFGGLPVMEGSQRAVEEMARDYDVFVASAAMEYPASCAYKFAWLRRHFPAIRPDHIVFCGEKSIVAAEFLIDDRCRHFPQFAGQGVLFSAPHNVGAAGWPRLANWEHAREVLRNGGLRSLLAAR
jgi:5'(3')-deoxyribonucleotidase